MKGLFCLSAKNGLIEMDMFVYTGNHVATKSKIC